MVMKIKNINFYLYFLLNFSYIKIGKYKGDFEAYDIENYKFFPF